MLCPGGTAASLPGALHGQRDGHQLQVLPLPHLHASAQQLSAGGLRRPPLQPRQLQVLKPSDQLWHPALGPAGDTRGDSGGLPGHVRAADPCTRQVTVRGSRQESLHTREFR